MATFSAARSRPAISTLSPIPRKRRRRRAQRAARTPFFNGKNNIFYVANNTASTYGIPVHLQRYMLIDYCKKNN